MNIVLDLLPWEAIFSLSSLGLAITGVSAVWSVVRRRRIGPLRRALLGLFVIGAVLPWLVVRGFGERLALTSTTNHVDTAANTPPDLQPRQYAATPQQVGDAVVAASEQLGWRVVARDDTQIQVEVPVARLGWFVDDLIVTLSTANNATVVNARSQSRVGRGDLGENRRHVEQLWALLDQQLERSMLEG